MEPGDLLGSERRPPVGVLLGERIRKGAERVDCTTPSSRYAEGGVAPAVQPADTHPPIATVLAGARPPDVVSRMLRAIGDTLVHELGLEPGNVFVTLQGVDPARLYDASG